MKISTALRTGGVAVAALALIGMSSSPGIANDTTYTPSAAAQVAVSHLLDVNPGVTQQDLLASAERLAASEGMDVDEVLQRLQAESAESVAAARSVGTFKEGEGTVPLGAGQNKGDVFTSPASTIFVEHGHDGIYYNQSTIVEAPGTSSNSRSISALTLMVGEGTVKQSVSVSQSARDAAANYAFDNMRGVPYNLVFFDNKYVPADKYNCSQLVWGAYLMATGIDLDSNGGWGVYPYNIKDSSYMVTYATL